MDLYLLRHAIAVKQGPSWSAHDADRPLSARGAKKMRRIAKALKQRHVALDLILSSPYCRARETAGIVADILGIPDRITISPHLKVGGSPAQLIRTLRAKHGKRVNVLLVGHEPYLSNLLSVLLSGKEGLAITMKKGGIGKLSVRNLRYGRCATLEWLIGPAQLLGLACACSAVLLTAML